ncbi:MAG: glycosyltransferase family 39 protein [Desulfarculaceae bacterium]|jgi:4-amino-4-deoxy-L-arabinose transferase-like glycosyltransferase
MPRPETKAGRHWLWLILALALVLRLGYVWAQTEHQLFRVALVAPDSMRYLALADNIRKHGFYSYDGREPTAADMPAYPLFLATVRSLWEQSHLPLYLIQALISTATVALVYVLGCRCFSVRAGLWASFLAAVYPLGYIFAASPLSEVLYTFLIILFLVLYQWAQEGALWALAAGISAGAAVLTRPVIAGFVVLVCLALLTRPGRRKAAVCLGMGMLLMLLPWAARNASTLGEFIPLSTRAGFELYLGNAPGATGGSGGHLIWGTDVTLPPPPPTGMRPTAWSRELASRVGQYLLQNPGHFFRRLPHKVYNMWRPTWAGASLRNWLLVGGIYLLIMGLALFCLARRQCARKGLFLWAFVLYHVAVHALIFGIIRYRIPVEPALCVLAGAGLAQLRIRGKESQPG